MIRYQRPMASRALSGPGTRAAPSRAGYGGLPVGQPVLIVLLFAIALTALNPAGYLGGGGDEYHYLTAARCAAEHGLCLPQDHWWRRWPIVAPTALSLRLLGESYLSVGLVPFGYALASVALLTAIVARQFGRAAGIIAGMTFAATPVVVSITLELGIDIPELLFVLAAIAAIQRAYEGQGTAERRWVVLAGLATGLAVQARPTALTLLPILAILFAVTDRRGWIRPFLFVAATPSLIEAAVYAAATGDPLLGWKLSLAHGRIPSTELLPNVDVSRSPLFNPDFIGGWRRPMGIEVHWLIDGLLNYVFNPAVAMTIAAAMVLLALEWPVLAARDRQATALRFAIMLAICWFGALTYAFAIDPKPRMFLPVLAVASATFGVLAVRRWQRGSGALVVVAFALILGKGAIAVHERVDMRPLAAVAPAMIARTEPGLSVDPRTARFLTLVAPVRALPLFEGRADQRRLLLVGMTSCDNAARDQGLSGWTTRRRFAPAGTEPAMVARLRASGLFLAPATRPVLCVMTR